MENNQKALELLNQTMERLSEVLKLKPLPVDEVEALTKLVDVLNYQRQIQSYSARGRTGQVQKSKEN